jgi:hypothetical protein
VVANEADDHPGKGRFGVAGQSQRTVFREAEDHLVFEAVKPHTGDGYIVGDNEVTAFPCAFFLSMGAELLRFCGEADEVAPKVKDAARCAQDIFRSFEL